MKKAVVFIMAVALLLCVLASCSNADKGIVGCWESTDKNGTTLSYEFREDGTGRISNGKDSAEFSYVAKDGTLTVTYGGTSEDAAYKVEGDNLTVSDAQGTTIMHRQ